jgi:hypothetical protein
MNSMQVNDNEITGFLGDIDIFICSSGFEMRSKSLALKLNSKKIKKSLIFAVEDNYSISDMNSAEIMSNINQTEKITFQKNNPIEIFDIFYHILEKYEAKEISNVVIDVTTFTKENLLILIRAISLNKFINKFNVNLVYRPAESYIDDWLTKGVRQIRAVFGYSGLNYPSKKTLLIVLNGFENERTEEIIDSFEPSKIILGKPSKINSINDNLNVISDEKFSRILKSYKSKITEQFEFSCIDILKTKEIIEEIVLNNEKDYNIIIAPLNNKISTLSVGLLALENDDIQICYASANQYNIKNYSKESNYFLVNNLNYLLK